EHSVEAVTSSLKTVFDLRHSRPGDQFLVSTSDGAVDLFDYRRDSLNEWNLRREGEQLIASKREVEIENRVELIELSIESAVCDAAKAAGEDPSVAIDLSDVFAWDIDFYRD